MTQENIREDFTFDSAGRYYTLDLPLKLGPDDPEDQLFLELYRNLTYFVLIHDPEYFLFNVNPIALPTATQKFKTTKKNRSKKKKLDSWYFRLE